MHLTVLIIGNAGVGKTAYTEQLVSGTFGVGRYRDIHRIMVPTDHGDFTIDFVTRHTDV